jgi:hypothetical protein
MKKIYFLVLFFSLMSCHKEYQEKKDQFKTKLPYLEFDYNLYDKNVPAKIHEFQKVDFGLALV